MKQFVKKTVEHIQRNKYTNILFLFSFTFGVYVHNLSPSVYGGDAGDLINAAFAKGVAHPSGYPLYTMLGILALKIPISQPAAWMVGLVSSVSSALTVAVFYLLMFELTKSKYLSVLSSLTLAFLYTFWLYSEIAEVFTLHGLFIVILVYLIVKYIDLKKDIYIYLIAFFSGLSLTNNHSIIVLFPPIAIVIVWVNPKILISIKTIIKSLFFALLGLIPYLYIPIAASKNPYYNWGEVKSIENFLYLFLRKDYGWAVKSQFNPSITISHFASYYDYLKAYVYPLIPVLAFLGILYLIINKYYKLVFLFVSSYLFFVFFLVYTRSPLDDFMIFATFEKFYIAGFIFLVILFTYGLIFIQSIILKTIKQNKFKVLLNKIVLLTFFVIPAALFVSNFKKTNLSNIYIGNNFAIDILSSLPENSVVLLRGDHEHFNSVYVQNFYGLRKDVRLAGRNNGFEDLLKSLNMNEVEIDKYKIEHKSAIELETFYAAIVSLAEQGNFFIDSKIGPNEVYSDKLGRLEYIPYGLFYKLEFENNPKLSNDKYLEEIERYTSNYHLDDLNKNKYIAENNLMYADIRSTYASAYYKIAKYLSTEYEDHQSAAIFLNKAVETDPLFVASKVNN